MSRISKKCLSLLLSFALINSSFQPLHATMPDSEDKVIREVKMRSRMMMFEDALQEKIKRSASFIEGWTPSFIKKAAVKVGTWLESTLKELPHSYFGKNVQEIDYIHDKAYWLAHFSDAVQEIQAKRLTGQPLQERLAQLQDLVFNGVLSPYAYEKGLREIEGLQPGNQALFTRVRREFKEALNYASRFIDETFRREASLYLQDLQTQQADPQEFVSFIRHYRDINNALDYKDTLTAVRGYLQQHKKELMVTKKGYDIIIATLNTEIERTSKQERKRLQANQVFYLAAASILPYYNQEWDEIKAPTNNSLIQFSMNRNIKEDYLTASAQALRKFVYTSAKFIQEHPGQVLMMALAGQVAAAAALKSLTGPKSARETNSQIRPQETPQEEETAEQRHPQRFLSKLQRAAKRNIGDEFLINQNTTIPHYNPDVAALPGGNIFVAWDAIQTGSSDAYGRMFLYNGLPQSSEFNINQNTTYNQAYPSVVGLTNNNAFVVWQSGQGNAYDIYGRLFSSDGVALNPEFIINQVTSNILQRPSIASLVNGSVFIAWEGMQTGDLDIYGRLFLANGTALGPEFRLNQNTTYTQQNPAVVGISNGNVFASWRGNQAQNWDIYGRLFSSNGAALNPEFVINQNTTSYIDDPFSIASLANGNVFVVWQGTMPMEIWDIYGRFFSANGIASGSEFRINQKTYYSQLYPSVAALTDGNIFVAWGSDDTVDNGGTNDWNIYGRLFSAYGTALSSEFSINQNTTGQQTNPSAVVLANGSVFVAWISDQGNPGLISNIYGRILTAEFLNISAPSMTGTAGSLITGTTGTSALPTTGSVSTTGTTASLTTSTSVPSSLGSITTEQLTFQEFSKPSSSSINSALIIGPVIGGFAITTATGIGVWKYMSHKKAVRERDLYPFASYLKEKLKLDVKDYTSDAGHAYLNAVESLSTKLASQGVNTRDMNAQALNELCGISAKAIKETLTLTSIKGGKAFTLNPSTLEQTAEQLASTISAQYQFKALEQWEIFTHRSLMPEETTLNIEMDALKEAKVPL